MPKDRAITTKKTNAEIRSENEVKILDAAERMFSEYGYGGASMQQIADVAELPKSNILYYFKSKKNLYDLILESMLMSWLDAADEFENRATPEEAITAYVRSKMKFARERPYGSTVWAKEIMSGAPLLDTSLTEKFNRWTLERVGVLEQWMAKGLINISDPHAFLYLIWSTTQHYADFKTQLMMLHNNKEFTDAEFEAKTVAVTQMILRSAGLPSTPR